MWRQRTLRTTARTSVGMPQASRCHHVLAGLTSWMRCLVSPQPEPPRHRARRLQLDNQAVLGVAAGCADAPALGSEQLLGQDAEDHPSDPVVCLHTARRTRWGCSLTTILSISCRRGRVPRRSPYRLSATCRDAVQGRGMRRAQRARPGRRRRPRGTASRARARQSQRSPVTRKREDPRSCGWSSDRFARVEPRRKGAAPNQCSLTAHTCTTSAHGICSQH